MKNGAEVRGRRGSLASVVVAVLVMACGGGTPDTGDATEPDRPEEETTVPADDDRQDFAIADAAERAGVGPEAVTVVTDENVTWSDGALGCPQPGQFYTQALVEGYRVIVEAGGEEYHYHGQSGQPPTYCENPTPPSGGNSGVVDR